jgi:hypothetical protein
MFHKPLSMFVLLLSVALILVLFVAPVAAQGEDITETFDNAQLPGWEHSPEVAVKDGILLIAPGNFAARMGVWQNFDLTCKLRFDSPGESEIRYHSTENGGYSLIFTPDRLVLLKSGRPGSTPTEMAGTALDAISAGEWISVHITLTGGQHAITVNDTLQLNATDSAPILMGGLVFSSRGERTTELDDLNLKVAAGEPGAQVAPPQPQQPTSVQATPTLASSSIQDFLQSLSSTQGSTFDLATFAINLVLAVVTSFILSRVYVVWGASLSNRRKFAANFMLVTVTTTFIILVVRSSVALSLGLVGALSIIRFRAAIKEPEELAYLFFAISLGIGLGDNQRLVTLLTLVVIILVLGLAHLLRQTQADVNLNMSLASHRPEKITMKQVMDALEKHCEKLRLIRYDETPEALEISFVVEFRSSTDLDQARTALLALSGGLEISFLDNKGIW